MPESLPPIELQGVTFSYEGDRPLLRDIDLTIGEGEFVGIIGTSGSGKSTLLNIMAGVIPHYIQGNLLGEIRIRGIETRQLSLPEIARHVGVVTQDPENQLFNLLVRDEVVWALENRGFTRSAMEERLRETLAFFDISHLPDRITYDLSGGEKQRVVLAATYCFWPEILIVDNPTSQLDPVGSQMVIESFKRILRAGQTIVMVEDRIDELLEHADRLVFLHQGRIILDVSPAHLSEHADVLAAIGIRPPEVIELTQRLRAAGATLNRVPSGLDDAIELFRAALDGRSPVPAAPVETSSTEIRQAHPPHLVVEDVSFSYPPPRVIRALNGINLSLEHSSFVAVIGKNGSGKTTLARCMSGYLRPGQGQVLIDGQSVHRLPLRTRTQKVGYVFQNPDHQIFKDPVRTDIEFGPRNLGWSQEKIRERVDWVLDRLRLRPFEHVHPFMLSKGNRQRLAIAAIAVMEPEVLIVDEPTTGQDPAHAREIMDLLTELREEKGLTIVIITHSMNLIGDYADRVIALSEGQILIDGTPRDVFAHPEILERTSVVPPPVTQLALKLGLRPPPLTVDEAVERLLPLLGVAPPELSG